VSLDLKDLPLTDELAFLHRNASITYGASAICLDPNLFFKEADSSDSVVPVCHHYTPAIGLLAKHAI
jgi:hypothetical protein